MANIDDCKIIELNKKGSHKGSLTFTESADSTPFDIKRIYFTYDIPTAAERAHV